MAKINIPMGLNGEPDLTHEAKKLSELIYKADRTTSGVSSFVSETSNIAYSTNDELGDTSIYNRGEVGLIKLLQKKYGSKNSSYNFLLLAEDINEIANNTGETAESILDKMKTVDGSGSGLDADMVDGKHASEFALSAHIHDNATSSKDGFITKEDKTKLDEMVSGGYVTIGKAEGHTLGEKSTAEGYNTLVRGAYSHAEGVSTMIGASGTLKLEESYVANSTAFVVENIPNTLAIGDYVIDKKGSMSEPMHTWVMITNIDTLTKTITIDNPLSNEYILFGTALETCSSADLIWGAHAEGWYTVASAYGTHAEGYETQAKGEYSHTEGEYSCAEGRSSHAEGLWTISSGKYSHAEGKGTIASSFCTHTEGVYTQAIGEGSHAEGKNTKAQGESSHAEGVGTIAGQCAHAEGCATKAEGIFSHAEGSESLAFTYASHAEGYKTQAMGDSSHAEGIQTQAAGPSSHAEGSETIAAGPSSHAEGSETKVLGDFSHAEGKSSSASGRTSHAEGLVTQAKGHASHAEGNYCIAEGTNSHAEGNGSLAKGENSHAEGYDTQAMGNASHTQGYKCIAKGKYAHAAGCLTQANGFAQTVIGSYNVEQGDSEKTDFESLLDTDHIFIVGNGNSSASKSNALTLTKEGILDVKKNITINGTPIVASDTLHAVATSGLYRELDFTPLFHNSVYEPFSQVSSNVRGSKIWCVKNIFVGSAAEGGIWVSTDGEAWTKYFLSTGSEKTLKALAYGNNVFVGVDNSNTVVISTDGESWTASTTFTDLTMDICYSDELKKFVAMTTSSDANVHISDDNGMTWKNVSMGKWDGKHVGNMRSIAYGNGRFVAVGTGGINNIVKPFAAVSFDAVNWVIYDSGIINTMVGNSYPTVAFGNGTFVYAFEASSPNSVVGTSKDGITWETLNLSSGIYSLSNINFYNGLFAATASNSDTISISSDGKQWDKLQLPNNSGYFKDCACNNKGLWIVISERTNGYPIAKAHLNASYTEALFVPEHNHDNVYSKSSHSHNVATTLSNGFMSSSDKAKLDSVIIGGYVTAGQSNGTTLGAYATAEGYKTIATASCTHAEGTGTTASNQNAHAEGNCCKAQAPHSHAEGCEAIVGIDAACAHAEGYKTQALGSNSHAEGDSAVASGKSSHAEGWTTQAKGKYTHAEGNYSIAEGENSHAEGCDTITSVEATHSHVEGYATKTMASSAHAEGSLTTASGSCSHSEGNETIASGDYSHSEGHKTIASGNYSHAEGNGTVASDCGHAEGQHTKALAANSHAEGCGTTAVGQYSHAEGCNTFIGNYATALLSQAYVADSNTFVVNSIPMGLSVHDIVFNYELSCHAKITEINTSTKTITTESWLCTSNLPTGTKIIFNLVSLSVESFGLNAMSAHAEGEYTIASGHNSHAEGSGTISQGNCSHSGGIGTIAADYQYTTGKYNSEKTGGKGTQGDGVFIIGCGTSSTVRANAFRVSSAGKVYGNGAFNTTGADYAELFEWEDGNTENDDRRGLFVVLDNDKIRLASENESGYILGVISGNPAILGDSFSDQWKGMYLYDIFGTPITDENGQYLINPEYDHTKEFTPRENRKEWGAVGMFGKLVVTDDGTCVPNGYCQPKAGGIATASDTGYRVMKRLDNTHVYVLVK